MRANGVTDPAGTPSTSISNSGLPKLRRSAPSFLCNVLRSIWAWPSATTRNSRSFLSLRNRFLVWPPGSSRSSLELSATVKTASCSSVLGGDAELGRGGRAGLGGWRATAGFRSSGASPILAAAPPRSMPRPGRPGGPTRHARPPARGRGRALANGPILLHKAALGRGCSSGVEHHVANVRVEGSNPFARSIEVLRKKKAPSEARCRP